MACSVPEIRQHLSPDENAIYKDYQIQRWLNAKKGSKSDTLKLIASSHAHEQRLKAILTNPQRKEATVRELGRNVLSVIHVAPKREVILYINTRNKNTRFVEQEQGDALLVAMFYLQHKVEELVGEGNQATTVIDMLDAPTPKITDMEADARMFSNITGHTFTGLLGQQFLCCSWNVLARKAVSGLARSVGMPAQFVTAEELFAKYGKASMPTFIGGDHNLEAWTPAGVLAMEYVEHNFQKLVPGTFSAAPPPVEESAGGRQTSAGPSLVDQYALFLVVGCLVVAILVGEYITLTLLAGGLLFLKFGLPQTGLLDTLTASTAPTPATSTAAYSPDGRPTTPLSDVPLTDEDDGRRHRLKHALHWRHGSEDEGRRSPVQYRPNVSPIRPTSSPTGVRPGPSPLRYAPSPKSPTQDTDPYHRLKNKFTDKMENFRHD